MTVQVQFLNSAVVRAEFQLRWGDNWSPPTRTVNAGGWTYLTLEDGAPLAGTPVWAHANIEVADDCGTDDKFIMPLPTQNVSLLEPYVGAPPPAIIYSLTGTAFGTQLSLDQEYWPRATAEQLARAAECEVIRQRYPITNGMRVGDPREGKLYVMLDWMLRHIPNPATFDNLFRDWSYVEVPRADAYPVGPPLPDGAYLANGLPDGRVYLVGGGEKRWITSLRIFDLYGFDSTKIRSRPVEQLNALPTGSTISDAQDMVGIAIASVFQALAK